MMDVEGGRAVRRSSRGGRLAAVVAVQNLLVVACLMVTVYLYMSSPALPEDIVNIQFQVGAGFKSNTTLELNMRSGYKLQNNKGNITISCTGPYVWHMQVCYQNMGKGQGNVKGSLTLQVKYTPVSSINMDATKNEVCRGLQSIVYLKAGDVASFHLFSAYKDFRMVNVSMGLSYLLGNKCDY